MSHTRSTLDTLVHGPGEHEPTDLEIAIWDRGEYLGWPYVGPLIREMAKAEAAYERYCEESALEYEAQQAAGGRTICPNCRQRSVKHSTACTLGYPGHPGAEFSAYEECENCDYKDLA